MRLTKEAEEALNNVRKLNEQGGTDEEIKAALIELLKANVEPDITEMNLPQLQDYKEELFERMDKLEDEEPDEEDEDAYDDWEVECEELEDLIEDVDELIEELS